jgi:hypothetical protein
MGRSGRFRGSVSLVPAWLALRDKEAVMGTSTEQSMWPHVIDSSIDKIQWRINWCRCQQRNAGTTEDCAAWWAEEAGLRDALAGRDRTIFMKAGHGPQVQRYLRGLHDGQALLCLAEPARQRSMQTPGTLAF